MMLLHIKHKEYTNLPEETIFGVISYTKDFRRGTVQINAQTENGLTYGEYSMADVEDFEEEFIEDDSPDAARGLTTYQQRAIRNLPPKIAGMPDLTNDALVPLVASPTPTVMSEEKADTGLTNVEEARSLSRSRDRVNA